MTNKTNLKDKILEKIVPKNHFPTLEKESVDAKGWTVGCCPFHNDKNPSFSYNGSTGVWVCHVDCGKGDIFDFIEKDKSMDFKEVIEHLALEYDIKKDRPPIPERIVKDAMKALSGDMLKYLLKKRGFTKETLEQYEIGWLQNLQRITVPVRDGSGTLKNIRLYGPSKDKNKMISYYVLDNDDKISYGSPIRLYGLDELIKYQGDQVIFCEGEWDRLVLVQNGYMAVTGTGGASSFKKEWIKYFRNRKEVIICMDCDNAGKDAANKIIKLFQQENIAVKNLVLPLAGTKDDKDVTDYFKKYKLRDFNILVETAPYVQREDPNNADDAIPIELSSFLDIEDNKYVNKRVKCHITISGETSESYHAVESFEVTYCKVRAADKCHDCDGEFFLPKGSQEYIGSCMSTNAQVIGMLRTYCCKYGQKQQTIEVKTLRTVQEIFCHQRIENDLIEVNNQVVQPVQNQELFERRAYYLHSGRVAPGDYLATGYVKTHPKTQVITFLIEELICEEDDYMRVDRKALLPYLSDFQKLSYTEILEDLSNNVTHIYERDEMLMAVLLTYFSPLWLNFNGNRIRGWIISVLIGDSGLGKTQTFSRISHFAKVGDFFSALTGSRTGLSYALVDSKNGWSVKIGKYPKNSGKILFVDEAQNLREEDILSLQVAMDSGFMQIEKVKSQGYKCATRMMLSCNPRDYKPMDSYTYGCNSLREIYPSTIIRRCDFAVFVNSGDIEDGDLINRLHDRKNEPVISPEMLRSAIHWVWQLKPSDIIFEEEATLACMKQAKLMAKKYHVVEIPLVARSDFKNNIARISAAFACLLLSTDEKFEKIIIKKSHVAKAIRFLGQIYSHSNCSLDEYSDYKGSLIDLSLGEYERLEKKFLEKARNEVKSNTGAGYFVKILSVIRRSECIRRDDLTEQTGCSFETGKKYIRDLAKQNLLEKNQRTNIGYVKTVKFNKFMKMLLKANPRFLTGGDY